MHTKNYPTARTVVIQSALCECIPQIDNSVTRAQLLSYVWLSVTPWTIAQPPLSRGFSWQDNGVSCHFLLQEIFLTQGSNPHLLCLLHWQMNSLPRCHSTLLENMKIHSLRVLIFESVTKLLAFRFEDYYWAAAKFDMALTMWHRLMQKWINKISKLYLSQKSL